MWSAGINPGAAFDCYKPSPLLELYITEDKVPYGRALVPGCGRGYDVTALADEKRYVLGLDIAEGAIRAANERLDKIALSLEDNAAKILKENSEFDVTSFFDLNLSAPNLFDFVYDYTFLCALDPSIRTDWATKMSQIIKSGGELLTLIFPIIDDESYTSGPPFKVTLETYSDLLIPAGFECLELRDLPPELSHEGRDGQSKRNSNSFAGSSAVGRWRRI